MSDLRRISFPACLFLVLLRIAIGWQFLYEGLWKINTQRTSRPWTAEGYLKNAQGPFRDYYRNLTGDPDDLNWIDYENVISRWDKWHSHFISHYKLDENQKRVLDQMLNGSSAYYASLVELPEGVEFKGSLGKAISFDDQNGRLVVDGKLHLTPRERDRLLEMVSVEENPSEENKQKNELAKAYQQAIRDVYARSSRSANAQRNGMSFKERLLASLEGDPERAGKILEEQKGTIDYKQMGDIELYKAELVRYEQNLVQAQTQFQFDHLKKQKNDLMALKNRLVGPVKALDGELRDEAAKILTVEQMARGPVILPLDQMGRIDRLTIWALTIPGCLLIAGLFSRLSALAAAGLLVSFYLAMPPWPGVQEFMELPGPEHSFIVDKNLIEVIALLGIAMLPTGRWFGIDALLRRFVLRRKSD